MKKFLHSCFVNLFLLFDLKMLTLIALVIITAIIYYCVGLKKQLGGLKAKTVFITFVEFLYLCPYWLGIIHRIGEPKVDATAKIFDGWTIIEMRYGFEVLAFANFFLFTPFAVLFCIYLLKYKNADNKKLILLPTVLSFVMSLAIELTQLIASMGTFQISDLVYNTLGGTFGALLILIIHTLYNKRKS